MWLTGNAKSEINHPSESQLIPFNVMETWYLKTPLKTDSCFHQLYLSYEICFHISFLFTMLSNWLAFITWKGTIEQLLKRDRHKYNFFFHQVKAMCVCLNVIILSLLIFVNQGNRCYWNVWLFYLITTNKNCSIRVREAFYFRMFSRQYVVIQRDQSKCLHLNSYKPW